jgi:uncharacterized protein YjbI with pentapeptide repeats
LVLLLVVLVLVSLIVAGYWVSWTGFSGHYDSKGDWHGEKTLWDWMDLLIVPLVLGGGVAWLKWAIDKSQNREAARRQAENQLELEMERSREAALQLYLDQMQDLLQRQELRGSEPGSVIRSLARARTLTALHQLDGVRKGVLLLFMYESGLVVGDAIVSLRMADLSGCELRFADLTGADLKGANLESADLSGTILQQTNLSGAYMVEASLVGAILSEANLRGTYLRRAVLSDADLGGTELSGAVLEGTAVTDEQLAQAASLKGAILPDGTVRK